MQKRDMATAVILACVLGAGMVSPVLAERGPQEGPMPGFLFDTLDADKDGKVTAAEIEANRAARVKAADANNDGLMSADELAAMRLAEMSERAKAHAAEMVTRMDTDGDAMLSGAELAARPGPARMFKRIDTDGDGAISREEAAAAADMHADRRGKRGDSHHDRGSDN